jgi:hypothetical protein
MKNAANTARARKARSCYMLAPFMVRPSLA